MNLHWTYLLAGAIAAVALAGCANSSAGPQTKLHTQSTAYQTPSSTMHTNKQDHHPSDQGTNAYNYRYGYTSNGFNQDLAEQLTRAADDVPGVERVSAVVSGRDAVVGIRARSNLAEQQVNVIEQQVQLATHAIAPSLNIRVTSDPVMFHRLRAINATIYNEATHAKNSVISGPTTRASSMNNAADDFSVIVSDWGSKATAPSR